MSDSKKEESFNIRETTVKTRDIQKQIVAMMIKRNPNCTVAEVGRNYENLKKYLTGE